MNRHQTLGPLARPWLPTLALLMMTMTLTLASLTLLAPSVSVASERLDVDRHLRAAATRAVVVILHASWSAESTARLPAWGKVHDAWHAKGLRTVIVNTQDPTGGCGGMAWVPDEVICDVDGAVPAKLGATGVGVAYAWDWRGRALGRGLDPAGLQASIAGALGETPALAVRVDKGPAAHKAAAAHKAQAAALLSGAAEALKATPRLAALAGAEGRKLGLGDAKPCERGRALPSRGVVVLGVERDGRPTVTAALRDPAAGCTIAEGSAGLTPGKEAAGAKGAVVDLIRALQRPAKLR